MNLGGEDTDSNHIQTIAPPLHSKEHPMKATVASVMVTLCDTWLA